MNTDSTTNRQSSSHELDRRYSPGRDAHRALPAMSTIATTNTALPYTASQSMPSQLYHSTSPSNLPPRHMPDVAVPFEVHPLDSRRNSIEHREHTRLPSIKEAFGLPQENRSNSTYTYNSAPAAHTYAHANSSTTPTSRSFPQDPAPLLSRYGPDQYHPSSASAPVDHPEARVTQNPGIDAARQQIPPNDVTPIYAGRAPQRQDIDARPVERSDHFSRYESSGHIDQYRGYPVASPHPAQITSPHERAQYTSATRHIEHWGPSPSASTSHAVPYETTLKRKFDAWDVEQNLNVIADSSSRIASMSSEALRQMQRFGRSSSSESNPTIQTCDAMLREADRLRSNLLAMREAVLIQDRYLIEQQQFREPGGGRDYLREKQENLQYEPRNLHIERQNGMKRRGRAAPPGNCHSCHRAETPEWRRGPDGARTLCNACGLHYAKLAKKTASENIKTGTTQQQATPVQPRSVEGV